MRIIGAEVTTGYSADGTPIRTSLEEGVVTEGAVTSASIRLFFSRFLWPSTIIRQSVCLHPSTETIERIQDCREPFQPFTSPQYSPTDRAVTYRLPPGSRLDADTQYRLTVFAAESPDEATGFFAFDGAPLDRAYTFELRTQADDSTSQDEPGPSPETYCAQVACGSDCEADRAACTDACVETLDSCTESCMGDTTCEEGCESDFDACVAPCDDAATACQGACGCFEPSCTIGGDLVEAGLFNGTCAFGQCHAPGGDPELIAMGLDLSSPSAIAATAINRTAHQTQMGEQSVIGTEDPRRFGRAMPLIDPGNPGNSYLLYKVLANDLTFVTSLEDAGSLDPGLAEEIDRLRASVVVGLPMPAQSASGPPNGINFAVDEVGFYESARLLELWIASGAVTSCDDL